MNLLQTEGLSELARAKNKSNQFDHQSEQMSDISRNARKFAEDLEKSAENSRNKAKEAKEKAIRASEVAKETIELQRAVTDQLKTKIVPEFPKEAKKLESLKKLTSESLEKANSVYEDSLQLYANINGLASVELDLAPIKDDAAELIAASDEISEELNGVLDKNKDLLDNVDESLSLTELLINR